MIKICKKFEEIPEMFHYNPVKLMKKTKLFPNIETYHIYDQKEKKIEGYDRYAHWHTVSYETYLNKKENEEFKNVRFCPGDWNKYNSFKGANILGENSFGLNTLTEIDLNGITKLERSCFYSNRHIKYVKLNKAISTIPDYCFANCGSLVELDLSYIKILGSYCFHYCTSLTALTLPEILWEVKENCFYGLNDLEKIETKGVKLIELNMNYSLYMSFKRNGINVKGDILYNNYDRTKYENEIPDGVSIICSYCFSNLTTIGDVILPKSVTKLENFCFNNCSIKSVDLSYVIENKCDFEYCCGLTSVTLNKRFIDYSESNFYPFYNRLLSLKNIELSDTNHIPIVSNHLRILMDEKGYKYDKCIYTQQDRIDTNSIIPEKVNIICDNIFSDLSNSQPITIPSSLNQIFSFNFYSMSNLESIQILSTSLQCGHCCFYKLPKIIELDLRGITSFESDSIWYCPSLTKLIIRNIPIENGFIGCDSLKDIEIIGIENNVYEHPINYKVAQLLENKGIHCKTKIFNNYQSNNSQQETYCVPGGVNEITSHAFDYCKLKEITIPSSVTLIKSDAFLYCNELTHLIIEGNPEFEKNCFCGCSQLIQLQPKLGQYS